MSGNTHWIAWPAALLAEQEPTPASACWWALEFSPRVVLLEDALLLETGMVQRLWGGLQPMLKRLEQAFARACTVAAEQPVRAQGATAWLALARLRLAQQRAAQGLAESGPIPADALPLWTLRALQEHSAVLQRMGCQTWGDVRALPRAGLSRRIGSKPLRVLDEAYGLLPQPLDWLQLPQRFALRHDLGYPAHSAQAVLQSAQPLLRTLQLWLQARHHAVLALQLRWHHDLRRVDGQELPAWDELCIRTAQPTQGMEHLQRLLREHLGRLRWRAPVDMLELQALETVPWAAMPLSCLPAEGGAADHPNSLAWHEWVERIGARWGEDAVRQVEPCADHRPEAMQCWQSAAAWLRKKRPATPVNGCADPWQALWPPWLLPEPEALAVQANRPHWHGPLQLRAGPYRLESGWWDGTEALAVRDYFVAYNEVVGHVWIYRERSRSQLLAAAPSPASWFAQGVYG
ncbi:Y-family DNA polymerase [Comamonas guangdongensis]|uniref:DNA polymerase Y family protein n=1 Tax=Comamonas guangdongensis TaxID=510515 RepID=A0ABV3ZZW0_9BURK